LLLQFFLQCWGHAQNPDHQCDPAMVSTRMLTVWDRHYLRKLGGWDSGGRVTEYRVSGEALRNSLLYLGACHFNGAFWETQIYDALAYFEFIWIQVDSRLRKYPRHVMQRPFHSRAR
jgi:hypothetical protein